MTVQEQAGRLSLFEGLAIRVGAEAAIWEQIYRFIHALIVDGRLAAGAQLPGETHLAEKLGVTRVTLRRALRQLQQEGLLTARKGVGIFVRRPPARYTIADGRKFSEIFDADGRHVATRTLSVERRRAGGPVAEVLEIEPDAETVVAARVRLVDGQPVFLNVKTFPAARFPRFEAHYAPAQSVSDVYRAHAIRAYRRAEMRILGGFSSDEEAHALGLTPDTPVLYTRSLNIDGDGRPIEYSCGCWPLTTVEFVFSGTAR